MAGYPVDFVSSIVKMLLCLALFWFASGGQRSAVPGKKTLKELLEWLSVVGIVIGTSAGELSGFVVHS